MRVAKRTIIELCKRYGPHLSPPEGVDGTKLLWALSGNESNFGRICPPRHENSYHYGSRLYRRSKLLRDLTKEWGCLAHCSFGPWQVMLINVVRFSPLEMLDDPEKAIQAAVSHLNNAIFRPQKPKTLAQIADSYNSGNFRDKLVPADYIARLKRNYKKPLR